MVDKLTEQEIEELKKLERETEIPKEEEKIIPLIRNIYTVNGKQITQYKINIPKKFADFLGMNKGNFEVKSTLDKENNKIIFEVTKND